MATMNYDDVAMTITVQLTAAENQKLVVLRSKGFLPRVKDQFEAFIADKFRRVQNERIAVVREGMSAANDTQLNQIEQILGL